jgi:hypothetical protein
MGAPETVADAPIARCTEVPAARTDIPRLAIPVAAPQHPMPSGRWALWVCRQRR